MDDDEFYELWFETWESPALPESEIETPEPSDPNLYYNDWFPMD